MIPVPHAHVHETARDLVPLRAKCTSKDKSQVRVPETQAVIYGTKLAIELVSVPDYSRTAEYSPCANSLVPRLS